MIQQIGIGTQIGRYVIVEAKPEGAGGMSRVYIGQFMLAEDTPYYVALKIARVANPRGQPDDVDIYSEALTNEVEMLKRLRHPNIVRLYPITYDDRRRHMPYIARATNLPGQPWYCVMEYLAGGSLEDRIRQMGKLPLPEALEIAYQVALALDHIHSKGIAHLDVKPDNVLFRYPVEAKRPLEPVLIDFGIAAKAKKASLQAGTVAYMPPERLRLMRGEVAPEQVRDQSAVDIYGLGVLLYRMLTGHLPFEASDREHLITTILSRDPTSPRRWNRDIPAEVEGLILRTLEKDPARRPPLDEVMTYIDKALPPPRVANPDVKFIPGVRSGCSPQVAALGAAVFLVLGIALGWSVASLGGSPPSPTPTATATEPLTATAPAKAGPTQTRRPAGTVLPVTVLPSDSPVIITPTARPSNTPTRTNPLPRPSNTPPPTPRAPTEPPPTVTPPP